MAVMRVKRKATKRAQRMKVRRKVKKRKATTTPTAVTTAVTTTTNPSDILLRNANKGMYTVTKTVTVFITCQMEM